MKIYLATPNVEFPVTLGFWTEHERSMVLEEYGGIKYDLSECEMFSEPVLQVDVLGGVAYDCDFNTLPVSIHDYDNDKKGDEE